MKRNHTAASKKRHTKNITRLNMKLSGPARLCQPRVIFADKVNASPSNQIALHW
jgi:hypothetical protein